ncbi:transposase [Plakobranchus ocellatus]|uniref:Transposase n=1 Tax=Plakobranchus ocellatus TaxID=259542 RepID=A0AAV3Z815_9GAST|nr:transposase [Plakobranchus ocellatus]
MEGVVHMEFLEQGQTVNSERYISTLRALKLRLRRVRRDKDSILQHDNARPHTSRQTQDALRQLELTTLPHPAYSPELAPSDYYLFPQLKKYLKGYHYDNDEKVIADVRKWCRGQSSEFFADGVHQLVKRWRLCVDHEILRQLKEISFGGTMGKNQTLLVVLCLALLTFPLLAAPVEEILKEDVEVKHVEKRVIGIFALGLAALAGTSMVLEHTTKKLLKPSDALDLFKKKN